MQPLTTAAFSTAPHQKLKTSLKLLQNYFTGLLQLMNIFQHVQFEII